MSLHTPKHRGRLIGSLGAVAAIALLAMSGTAASAVSDAIDPAKQGSLTVNKFEQPDEVGTPSNGLPINTTGMVPLGDVEFTVQHVPGIDLTTNAGWEAAGKLTLAEAQAQASTPGKKEVTGADGVAKFPELDLGVYLVTETEVPTGVTAGAPFVVTVPMTHPTDLGSWLYDINVYPKNAVTGAEKSVQDGDATQLGDEVHFTITADIPMVEVIDGYKIVDPLDSKLDYVSADVTLTDSTKIEEGIDFELAHDAATNTVSVEFTEAGRATLAANARTARVQVVITTTVKEIGEISNTVHVYPNLASFTIEPGQPGGPVTPPVAVTKWGNLVVHKVDAESGASLGGATFQVYLSETDAVAETNPLTVGGVDEWTTEASTGLLTIPGLRFSNFTENVTLAEGDDRWQGYWLVETSAPAGYERLAEPVRGDVISADPAVVTIEVKNVLSNAGFTLPLTGGMGTWLLTGAGLLVLAGVATTTARKRRRAQALAPALS